MKKWLIGGLLVALVGVSAGVYFYFRGTEKHLQLIPKNAMVVGSIDYKSLMDKSDAGKLKDLEWFKAYQKTKDDAFKSEKDKNLKEVFDNPLSCGVNIMSDLFYYAAPFEESTIGALVFDINSESKFEATVKKLSPNSKIEGGKGFKAIYQGSSTALGWNSTGGIFVFIKNRNYDYEGVDSTAIHFLAASFARTKEESILSNKYFQEYNKGKKDLSLFLNFGEIANFSTKMSDDPMTAMLTGSLSGQFKDMYSWMNLDFQDNRVLLTTQVRSDNPDFEKLAMLKKDGISDLHAKCITNKDVYALMAVAVDPAKLFEYYEKVPTIKDGISTAAVLIGMNSEELKKLFGGEFSIALVDFKAPAAEPVSEATGKKSSEESESDEYADLDEYYEAPRNPLDDYPMPVFTCNFTSNNKDGLKKLIEKYMPKGEAPYYSFPVSSKLTLYMVENKDGFTVMNDQTLAETIAKSGQLADLPANVKDLVKGKASAVYMDMNVEHYPLALRTSMANSMGEANYKAFNDYMKLFKDVTGSGTQTSSELALNLNDGKGNSLYRILAQIDIVYKALNPKQ
ncbi:MAG: DUF4836 family protein [Chitinophagales bacterium]